VVCFLYFWCLDCFTVLLFYCWVWRVVFFEPCLFRNMIEVEKSFILLDDQIEDLVKDAVLFEEIVNHDVYYDEKDWRLLKSDIHLRLRNGVIEMKKMVPGLKKSSGVGISGFFEEMTDHNQIKKVLGIESNINLADVLPSQRFYVLAKYQIKRTSYKIDQFRIDVDQTDFGYNMVDIEILVDDENMAIKAEGEIAQFAQTHSLGNSPHRDKLREYLFQFRRDEFEKYLKG